MDENGWTCVSPPNRESGELAMFWRGVWLYSLRIVGKNKQKTTISRSFFCTWTIDVTRLSLFVFVEFYMCAVKYGACVSTVASSTTPHEKSVSKTSLIKS